MRTIVRYSAILVSLTIAVDLLGDDKPSTTSPYSKLHANWKSDRSQLKESDLPEHERKEKQDRLAAAYTKRFVDLAKERADDEETWMMCLIWVGVEGVPGEDFDSMMDLMRDQSASVENRIQLQLFLSELIDKQSERLDPALGEMALKHVSKGVRGAALYALAARATIRAERSGTVEQAATATELLERVIAEYPDESTYRGKNVDNASALLDRLHGPAAPGKPAPGLVGHTFDGELLNLASTKGKVVVLAFSGHWCAPCRAMHSVQKELGKEFSQQQLAIIEVNSDEVKNIDRVVDKMRTEGFTWTVIADGPDGPIAKKWRISSHPTYFVIDQNQIIRRRASGYLGDRLSQWVAELTAAESSP